MNQSAVLRYIKETRNGLYDDKSWGSSQFLTADNGQPGRFGEIRGVTEDGAPFRDEIWYPTDRSTGTRQPTPRTRAHSRGYIPDPRTNRAVGFSSTHEFRCALMLMANRLVVDVQDQPPAIAYVGKDGRQHTHTFDFRAKFVDGTFVAFAVKPTRDLKKSDIRDVIDRVRPNLGGFASQALILTERQLTPARAWNAKSILRARKYRNKIINEKVRAFVATIAGSVNAFDIASHFPEFGDAMNAVWCLLYDGVLVHERPERTLFDSPTVHVSR